MKRRGGSICANAGHPREITQQIIPTIGNATLHRRCESLLQQLTDPTTGLYPRGDKVTTRNSQGLHAIGLTRLEQLVRHPPHALDFPHVLKAERRLAQCVGTLKVEQLIHEPRGIHTLRRKVVHHLQQALSIGPEWAIVVFDEKTGVANQIIWQRQAMHNLLRHRGAQFRMAVKMAMARLVLKERFGLSDVMQKSRPHQGRRNGSRLTLSLVLCASEHTGHGKHAMGMVVNIVIMVDTALVKASSARKLGNGGTHHLGIALESISPKPGCENTLQLNANALARDGIKQWGTICQGPSRGRLHGKVQTASETHGAKHAKGVFLKTTARLPHRPDLTTRKVAHAVIEIEKSTNGVPGHGIHREIATREVIFNAVSLGDFLWMAAIGIEAVKAICGDLDALAVRNGSNAAELDARLNHADARSLECRLALLPRGRTAHIDIVGRCMHEGVANPAAHDPYLKTRRLKRAQHTTRGPRKSRSLKIDILICADIRHRFPFPVRFAHQYTDSAPHPPTPP